MAWGRYVVLALLGACQAGGVEIIVYPPTEVGPGVDPVDEVHLYAGLGAGQSARLLIPQFLQDRTRRGTLWAGDTDVPYEVQPAGPIAPARFTYAARGGGDHLTFIAVGMTAGRPTSAVALYDIAVPTDHIATYQIGLNPASPASPTSHDLNQLELWGPTPGDDRCVHLIDRRKDHDNPQYPITFISTSDDADCDGYPASDKSECDDHQYKGATTPSSSTLSCLEDSTALDPNGLTVESCVAGGLSCIDGQPDQRVDCSIRRPYCAPEALCTRCMDPDPQKRFDSCAIDPTGVPSPNPGVITCQIPTVANLATNSLTVCPHSIRLPLPSDPLAGGCATPMFHGPNKGGRWTTGIDVGNASYTATVVSMSPCAIVLDAPTVPTTLSDFPYGGLVAVDIGTGTGAVIPILLTLGTPGPACPAGKLVAQCTSTILPEDSIYSCLRGTQ